MRAERVQQVRAVHCFENVPLPEQGQARQFDAGVYSDGSLTLRRVSWKLPEMPHLSPESMAAVKHNQGLPDLKANGPLLMEFAWRRALPGSELIIEQLRFYDDEGLLLSQEQEESFGDTATVTLTFAAPFRDAVAFNLVITTLERRGTGQTEEFTLPNVSVPPSAYSIVYEYPATD